MTDECRHCGMGDIDGVVLIDADALLDLQRRAALAEPLLEDGRVAIRDELIEGAIKAGKFPPWRRDHYREQYDQDAPGTEQAINGMVADVVPVDLRGTDTTDLED